MWADDRRGHYSGAALGTASEVTRSAASGEKGDSTVAGNPVVLIHGYSDQGASFRHWEEILERSEGVEATRTERTER